MKELDVIQRMIDTVNDLPFMNNDKFDAILQSAEMIIKRFFGDSNKYMQELKVIRFRQMHHTTDENYHNWNFEKNELLRLFSRMREDIKLIKASEKPAETGERAENAYGKGPDRIFIVCGQDNEMKQSVIRIFEKLGLVPVILQETGIGGQAAVERIPEYPDVPSAIFLFSPNGEDSLKSAPSRTDRSQVPPLYPVFEVGYFAGRLGKNRIIVLHRNDINVEMLAGYFSFQGISYDSAGKWQFDMIKELKNCGYRVDANRLL